jgi:hypothetical protein
MAEYCMKLVTLFCKGHDAELPLVLALSRRPPQLPSVSCLVCAGGIVEKRLDEAKE